MRKRQERLNELASILRQVEAVAQRNEKSRIGELVQNLAVVYQLSKDVEELGNEEAKALAKSMADKTDQFITQLIAETVRVLESIDKELSEELKLGKELKARLERLLEDAVPS